MHFPSLAMAVMMTPAVLASPAARPGFRCGTRDPTPEELQIARALAAQDAGNGTVGDGNPINVNVYFHVLAASTSLDDGYLTVLPIRVNTPGYHSY